MQRRKNGVEIPARTGIWRLEAESSEPGDLDKQVADLLALVTDDLAIWKNLTTRYEGDIFTGLFLTSYNEGLSLSPETLYAIGSRGLMLDLDIYAQDEND